MIEKLSYPPFKTIHFINPFKNAAGGCEWRILTLYNEIKKFRKVCLWSQIEPDKRLSEKYPIKKMEVKKGIFPKFGTFVFVGAYMPDNWLKYTIPRRTVLIWNMHRKQKHLDELLNKISLNGKRIVEIVYASNLLKKLTGKPGIVQISPIDIGRFKLIGENYNDIRYFENIGCLNKFTVGRLSRDVPYKHHQNDPTLYKKLIENGCNIRIMGGTCLQKDFPSLADLESLSSAFEILPTCAEQPENFLQSLDCFYFRTSDKWVETFGRVVFEAMACGLPVVCHKSGGYADYIENGVNGFLFDTDEEAYDIILKLKNDTSLRKSIGNEARKTAERLFGKQAMHELINFYLRKK